MRENERHESEIAQMAIVAQLVTGQLAEKSAKTGCQMTAGDADYSRAAG